jgi:transglutaminase-like putative cysteine protease
LLIVMRLRVFHRNTYHYDPPAAGVIQVLRLTPRNHEGQYVVRWRIDVSADARLAAHEDAFGNLTHVFSADGPFGELTVEVDGEVETQNTNGVVRGTVERFAPSLFLRDTVLTQADAAIVGFARDIRGTAGGDVLAQLHALLDRLHQEMLHVTDETDSAANAAEAFARKRGLPRDLSHIFIGAAHSLGIPARYVAGYYGAGDAASTPATGHAWAEASVPDLGWVAFDPAHGFCPTDAHVRVAIGLDSLGAAPVRGMRYGPGTETLEVAIKVGQ